METILGTHTICQGKHLAIQGVDIDFGQGKQATFEMISFTEYDFGGVIIAAYDQVTREVIMIEQFQVWYGKKTLLLPRWGKEPGHTVLETAHKELLEETWYEAKTWIELSEIYSSPGFFNQHTVVVIALDPLLAPQSSQGDEIEETIAHRIPLAVAIQQIMDGTIIDARTIAALFMLQQHLQTHSIS